MKHEPKAKGKNRVNSLGGPISWVGLNLRGSPGRGKQLARLRGVSVMAHTCGSVGEGSNKGQWPLPAFCLDMMGNRRRQKMKRRT